MKKLLSVILSAVCLAGACLFSACGERQEENKESYSVFAPDGAPALALAGVMAEENAFDCEVVDPATIQTFVTGESPAADFCILPVLSAAQLLGTGENYRMLGTVTNGNLYFLSANGEELTSDNLSSLVGKKIGVVQLVNVPGLTLCSLFAQKGLQYRTTDKESATEDAINLIAMDAADVSPAAGCDYYLCPEPAATTKVLKTEGKLKIVGDLQELYGGGYPQAVAVAKKDLDKKTIGEFIGYLAAAKDYLVGADYNEVNSLLAAHRTEGLKASFTALDSQTILNCGVSFVAAQTDKARVTEYLTRVGEMKAGGVTLPSDAFYYAG